MRKILLSLVIIFSFLFISTAAAQDTLTFDEIVVTASKTGKFNSQSGRSILTVNIRDINFNPAATVEEMLESIPSVDVRNRGADGVQADISIRGGTFDQALILINGVPYNDPQTGHHNMNLPFALEDVEKLEILLGPGSRILGPNSFSGAVNIITQIPEKNITRLSLKGGQFGYYKLSAAQSLNFDGFSSSVSISSNHSEGYIENTDFDNFSAFLTGSYSFKSFDVFLQGGLNKKSFGANGFYSAAYPNQYEKTSSYFTSVSLKGGERIKYDLNFNYKKNFDEFRLFRDEAPDWYKEHNYHTSDVWGSDIMISYLTDISTSSFGISLREEGLLSNVLGYKSDSVKVRGLDAYYNRKASRTNFQLSGGQEFHLENIHFSAGIMFFYNKKYGAFFNPGFDIIYNFNENLSAFAGINKSMRLPTFTEIFYESLTHEGNPNLKPETALTPEAGVKIFQKDFFLSLSFYRRYGKNMMDWVRKAEDDKWKSENHSEIIANGIDFLFKYSFKLQSFLKDFSIGYSFIDVEKKTGEYISNQYLNYLKHKLTADVSLVLPFEIHLLISMVFQDRHSHFLSYPDNVKTDYLPFAVFDIKLTKEWRDFRASFKIANIFDTEYFDFGNIEMPGRWIYLGINYKIDWD